MTLLVQQRREFEAWFIGLRDDFARKRVQARITRLEAGNYGDSKPARNGVVELRIHYGPGYRLYTLKIARNAVVLLLGGTKATQTADVAEAADVASEIKAALKRTARSALPGKK